MDLTLATKRAGGRDVTHQIVIQLNGPAAPSTMSNVELCVKKCGSTVASGSGGCPAHVGALVDGLHTFDRKVNDI